MSNIEKEKNIKAALNAKLIESGERERLREYLVGKLTEIGWNDQIKNSCREILKQKGLYNITIDELVDEMAPKGRALVPDPIKKELLERIRKFLFQQPDL